MIKIEFRLSLRRCHISLRSFCNNLFLSSSFCFHAKPMSYGDPHYPHCGVSLIIPRRLIFLDLRPQLFLNNIRFSFLFNLDYHRDKKSKTIFDKKLSPCYMSKIEMYCFQMKSMPVVRDIDKYSGIIRQIYTRKFEMKCDFVSY